MEIRIKSVRLIFTFGFFFLLVVTSILDKVGIGLLSIAAIMLHESGHLLVMHLVKVHVQTISFHPFGIRICKSGIISYERELLVYAGGAAANILAVTVCALIIFFSPLREQITANGIKCIIFGIRAPRSFGEATTLFGILNFVMAAFNLLPIGRLDGGVILRLCLMRRGFIGTTDILQKAIGFILLSPILCAALWILPQGNFTLLLTAAYLAASIMQNTED